MADDGIEVQRLIRNLHNLCSSHNQPELITVQLRLHGVVCGADDVEAWLKGENLPDPNGVRWINHVIIHYIYKLEGEK